MDVDHWTIMAKISSERQATYFGQYGAMRPYLFFIIDMNREVDDEFVAQIIRNSFYNIVVEDVSYKKYFELHENEAFEFQYARMFFDELSNRYHYGKFRKLML